MFWLGEDQCGKVGHNVYEEEGLWRDLRWSIW